MESLPLQVGKSTSGTHLRCGFPFLPPRPLKLLQGRHARYALAPQCTGNSLRVLPTSGQCVKFIFAVQKKRRCLQQIPWNDVLNTHFNPIPVCEGGKAKMYTSQPPRQFQFRVHKSDAITRDSDLEGSQADSERGYRASFCFVGHGGAVSPVESAASWF